MNTMPLMIIRGLLVYLCHSLCLYYLSVPKVSKEASRRIWTSTFAVMSVFVSIIAVSMGYSSRSVAILYFLSIIYCLAVFLTTSAGPIQKNIFIFTSYSAFFMMAVAISQYAGDIFFDSDQIAIAIMRNAIHIAGLMVIRLHAGKAIINVTNEIRTGWNSLALFSIISCMLLSILTIEMMFQDEKRIYDLVKIIAVSLLDGSAYIIVFRMIDTMAKQTAAEKMETLLKNELEYEKEYIEHARRIRHDARHHSRILAEYLQDGDMESAKAYIAEYGTSFDSEKVPYWCENKAANALIRMAERHSEASGISFDAKAAIPEKLPLTDPELAIVLGNVLENAINACSSVRNPTISMKAVCRDDSLLIEICNSIAKPVQFEDGLPKSSRSDGGIGMKSVVSVLSDHGAMINFRQSNTIFTTQLIIPL